MTTTPRLWAALLAAMVGLTVMTTGCEREEPPAGEPTGVTAEPDAAGEAEPAAVVEVEEATRVKFNTLIDQVTQHIRSRNFEAAETGLGELSAMRGQLDESMRRQIETTRAALTAARTGAPAAPGAPGNPASP